MALFGDGQRHSSIHMPDLSGRLGGGMSEASAGRPTSNLHPLHHPHESAPHSSNGSSETDRLRELKRHLQHLELQLGAVAINGRDSGSEGKYYALTKKLQRLRADVLKEQRESEELQQVRVEVEQQRMFREENRRLFRR